MMALQVVVKISSYYWPRMAPHVIQISSYCLPRMAPHLLVENWALKHRFLNAGWFGMRKDFCSFVLGVCPLLQEYANIAYHSERRQNGVELEQQQDKSGIKRADLLKPVLPIVSIETPDWFFLYFGSFSVYLGLCFLRFRKYGEIFFCYRVRYELRL